MRKKTTHELLEILSSTKTIHELQKYADTVKNQAIQKYFHEYINEKILEKKLKIPDVIQASQIQRNYAYQILDGKKNPGRDKIIALCLALLLDLSETQRALAIAGEGQLYSKNRRDSILIFAITKKMSVLEVNEILSELGETLL